MSGKHDKASDESAPNGLLLTGPIVVRGVSRGVRGALRPSRSSRHRAAEEQLPDGDGVEVVPPRRTSEQATTLDVEPAGAETGEPRGPRDDGPAVGGDDDPVEPVSAGDQEEHDVAARRRPGPGTPDDDAGSTSSEPADRVVDLERGADPVEDGERSADGEPVDADASRPGLATDRPDGVGLAAGDQSPEGEQPAPASPRAAVAATPVRAARPPVRDRFRRESLGIAVLVVLALVCAGLIVAVVAKTRADAAAAAREAASYTPPALTPSSAAAADGPVVAVIGDESALRAASGVAADERWPALLGEALDARVVVLGSPGSGYATGGDGGDSFADLAATVPAAASSVVFVGGAADERVASLSLARAATEAFSAASERAPDATVVAVGPLFVPADADAAEIETLRTTLRSAARIADVGWIDPITSNWVTADAAADLTAKRSATIATRLQAALGDEG